MRLPTTRGPLSAGIVAALAGDAPLDVADLLARLDARAGDLLLDEDAQLALWTAYELHYAGFDGVDDGWEWNPDLLRVRAALEQRLEADLRRRTAPRVGAARGGDVAERLFAMVEDDDAPSVARFLQRRASADQVLEVLVHKSIYQLKEADPHTWVVPRLHGAAKVALVELQFDEYGAGRPERQHARLFADGMAACGLAADYGAYLDAVPACTLALNNTMSLLGLHRRLRGAAMGHLAAVEVSSSLPCRRYVQAIRRLGLPEEIAAYFDEHVEADAVHEQVATRDICGALVAEDPALEEDVLFGAAAYLLTEGLLAQHLLGCWERGASSLRPSATHHEAVA
ncbi:MAG: iron-containing redox enzyme family protein [Nocardioides sp.]